VELMQHGSTEGKAGAAGALTAMDASNDSAQHTIMLTLSD
jgi:hypothetical protein